MTILGINILTECQARHPETRKELERWRKLMKNTKFRDGQELHKTFGKKHDFAPPHCHVFDIVGGNFRLIALINFNTQTISLERILKHKEYDRWECK